MKVREAVFPVAGPGTRFLPATNAQPTEMLPLVDKPTIQYVVEEAVASELKEIILVTGARVGVAISVATAPPDIVFIDIGLPSIDCPEAGRRIRAAGGEG
jgi:CTP:molybdopterin cytidylyltransferase MocA